MWNFLLFQARRNERDVWISQWYLMTLHSFFSSECFQVPPVDWHRPGHCHWTPILPHWLLHFPLVLQEGSAGNETRAPPANVDGDGLSWTHLHFGRDSQGSWIVLRHLLTGPDKTVFALWFQPGPQASPCYTSCPESNQAIFSNLGVLLFQQHFLHRDHVLLMCKLLSLLSAGPCDKIH